LPLPIGRSVQLSLYRSRNRRGAKPPGPRALPVYQYLRAFCWLCCIRSLAHTCPCGADHRRSGEKGLFSSSMCPPGRLKVHPPVEVGLYRDYKDRVQCFAISGAPPALPTYPCKCGVPFWSHIYSAAATRDSRCKLGERCAPHGEIAFPTTGMFCGSYSG
jgi:hypothetical protein